MGSTRCHRSLPLIRMATPYQGAAAGEPPEAQGQVEAPVARGSRLSADRRPQKSITRLLKSGRNCSVNVEEVRGLGHDTRLHKAPVPISCRRQICIWGSDGCRLCSRCFGRSPTRMDRSHHLCCQSDLLLAMRCGSRTGEHPLLPSDVSWSLPTESSNGSASQYGEAGMVSGRFIRRKPRPARSLSGGERCAVRCLTRVYGLLQSNTAQ